MPRHRLNTDTPMTPATQMILDSASRTGRSGQHRVAKTNAVPATATAGAVVAVAGAIGLTVGGAAQAAAQPAPAVNLQEAVASIPGLPALPELQALPTEVALPADLALPAPIDEVVRDLLGSTGSTMPGPGTAVSPTTGTVTSGYGPRWGTTHHGLDIANSIGTPVYAVTDGTVLESGPASGFGQWVRVQQDDGTIGVFGHVDQSFVSAGQKVRAGDQIATVGNRGQSTGPHLHYEVWAADGTKINPQVWLNNRGVFL